MVMEKRIGRSPVTWFVGAALLLVTSGFVASALLGMGDSALDIAIHDSYIVVARWHLVLITGLFCLGCAIVYWAFPHLFHRRLDGTLGLIHSVLTFIGLLGFFFPMHLIGAVGAPHRYYDYTEFEPMEGAGGTVDLNMVVTGFALLFLIGQSILIVNVIRTLLRPPGA